MKPTKILIIAIARFGDTLLITPVIHALKKQWPDAAIDVLAHKRSACILTHNPDIARVGVFSKKRALFAGWLSRKSYDLALVYGNDKALIYYAQRVSQHTIAFADVNKTEKTKNITWVARPQALMAAQHERALLINTLGIYPNCWRLHYTVSEDEKQIAQQFLNANALINKHIVGFQLQSFPTKAYRDWPVEKFYQLAKQIISHDEQAYILLLGGEDSQSLAESLAEKIGKTHCFALAGKVSMRENAAIMANLSLYVGVDTGPTHLAGALNIPMVALYHSYHPGCYLAPLQHSCCKIIQHPTPLNKASRDDTMADISVDEVWQAVSDIMNTKWKKGEK